MERAYLLVAFAVRHVAADSPSPPPPKPPLPNLYTMDKMLNPILYTAGFVVLSLMTACCCSVFVLFLSSCTQRRERMRMVRSQQREFEAMAKSAAELAQKASDVTEDVAKGDVAKFIPDS